MYVVTTSNSGCQGFVVAKQEKLLSLVISLKPGSHMPLTCLGHSFQQNVGHPSGMWEHYFKTGITICLGYWLLACLQSWVQFDLNSILAVVRDKSVLWECHQQGPLLWHTSSIFPQFLKFLINVSTPIWVVGDALQMHCRLD